MKKIIIVMFVAGILAGTTVTRALFGGEPTNSNEAARQQKQASGITPEMLEREARRKAVMVPEQLAWEQTLEANLGNFYLPNYYKDKDVNRETAWDYVKDDPALPLYESSEALGLKYETHGSRRGDSFAREDQYANG